MFRRPRPAFALGFVVAVLALTLAHPDGRAALARLPGLLHVAEHTDFMTASPFSDAQLDSLLNSFDADQEKGAAVFQSTRYGGWGSVVSPGGDPYIREYCSLRLAADAIDHPLLVPTYFNDRIPPQQRFQKAVVMPNGAAMLYFGLGPYETVLRITRVDESTIISYSEVVVETAEDGTKVTRYVEPELEKMTIGDRDVVWQKHSDGVRHNLGGLAEKKTDTEIGRFLWEQDGLSCALNGRFLTRDEGVKIIESLKLYSGDR